MKQWIDKNDLCSIDTEHSFQLNIEHASAMSNYDIVIFVDASKAGVGKFNFTKIQPDSQPSFSTHTISPSSVTYLCKELYGKQPDVYLLQIRGYEWEMREGLSEEAKKNLDEACIFSCLQLQDWIDTEKEYEHV
jgi:hydrogenase maturation protease